MPKLIMLSGPSGSGKSTVASQILLSDANAVRLNRDMIREMSISKWTPKREGWIIAAEIAMARAAAELKKTILIDDTNLTASDEARWKGLAYAHGYLFEKRAMDVDIDTCIARDSLRAGKARVGRAAIERQFLRGKLWRVPEGMPVVIFDVDGTLADLQHRVPWITIGASCPNCRGNVVPDCLVCKGTGKLVKKQHDVFYSLVERDEPIEAVIKWVQACYAAGFFVIIVSGRSPETSAEGTYAWLATHNVPYHRIIMRRAYMQGPDTEEKQLILDDLLKIIPKEQIAFVVDDRPSVVQMWKDNGLRVFPVRGRDDDQFYELMNNLEVTHPQRELQNEGNEK